MRFATSFFLLTILGAVPAVAGGVAPQPAPPPVIVPIAEDDWTEFYIGGQIDQTMTFDTIAGAGFFVASYEGQLAGVFAGYRYDLGDIVIGAEIDYMTGELDVDEIAPNILLTGPTVGIDLLRVGAEVGVDLGDALVYGTAGLADITLDFATGENNGTGLFFGAGIDFRVSENVTIGAEILQHNIDNFDGIPGYEVDMLTAGLNVAFTF